MINVQNCKAVSSCEEIQGWKSRPDAFIMEPKLNGFRLIAGVAHDHVKFYTRSKKDNSGKLPQIEAELLQMFPPGTILDGEVVDLQQDGDKFVNDFERVQSVMLSKKERSVRLQETGRPLTYIVFDILGLGGEDLTGEPLIDRKQTLQSILNVTQPTHVAGVASFPASDEIYRALVENGFEGAVVKAKEAPYATGKRGHGWWKLKDQPTVDVIILGVGKEGEGGFDGMVGSVLFGQPSGEHKLGDGTWHHVPGFGEVLERGQASGLDMKERKYVTENMDSLIGTVMEVAHMGIYPDGISMRHPQFKRLRPDKPASEVEWHDK